MMAETELREYLNDHSQHCLKQSVNFIGIGIHSGQKVSITVHPALPNTGIIFIRDDLNPCTSIVASYKNVVETHLCTALGNGIIRIMTVEHLMAALYACGIDNAIINIDGEEVPTMDGSSHEFMEKFLDVGTIDQKVHRKEIIVQREVKIDLGDKSVALIPHNKTVFNFRIDFPNSFIDTQEFECELSCNSFKDDIAKARTFGFFEDITLLKNLGFAKGGSLENAIVIKNNCVLNTDGLRYDDEFVRHKILDAIGDMYMAQFPIRGKFIGNCSGHSLNNQLLKLLFSDQSYFLMG